jgi:alcohol dehydrogenase class IV
VTSLLLSNLNTTELPHIILLCTAQHHPDTAKKTTLLIMASFVYSSSPSRVIFGDGASPKLSDELTRQGLHAALILSTPEQINEAIVLQSRIGSDAVGIFSKATIHTPTSVTQEALEVAKALGADSLVSIGGGSTIGLGKAIAVRTGLSHICIPTTYAGSEMTPILGETVDGLKTIRRSARILPGTVIYDVNLTLSLPVELSATSGINAIAHAVEALYAPDTNQIIRLIANETIRALSQALVIIAQCSGQDHESRSQALYGAWLSGLCLGSTAMSLHHSLCHALGGSFGLPHAMLHTICEALDAPSDVLNGFISFNIESFHYCSCALLRAP